jgi:predicted acetyltransferase
MTVSVRTTESTGADRRWMESVYRDYLTDLQPEGTSTFPTLGEIGHRPPDLLASWFNDPNAQVLTILSDQHPVGFALVRVRYSLSGGQATDHTMAEFFIARPWRRRGVGMEAVRLIFDRFNGRWHVMVYMLNSSAVKFWRRAVASYAGGRQQERSGNGELHQYFESLPRRAR